MATFAGARHGALSCESIRCCIVGAVSSLVTLLLSAWSWLAGPFPEWRVATVPDFDSHVFVHGERVALTLRVEPEDTRRLPGVDFVVTDEHGLVVTEARARVSKNADGTPVAVLDDLPREIGWYAVWPKTRAWRRAEEYVPYCVLPPVRRAPSRVAPYGIDVAFSSKSPFSAKQVVRLVRLAGVSWIRDRISLASAFPEPARRNFEPALTNARLAKTAGLSVLQVFADNPRWMVPADSKISSELIHVYDIAAELGKVFADDVSAWEIWNEHDITHFGGATPDRYAAFLKAFSLGLASTSDAMRVLGPFARDPAIAGYARVLFSSDVSLYLDVYSFHTYAPIEHGKFYDVVSHHRKLGHLGGFSGKPTWMTETGRARRSSRLQDVVAQANYAVKSFVLARSAGVDRLFWFVMKPFSTSVGEFGLFRHDMTPLPYYQSIAVLTHALGDAEYRGRVPHPGVEMHVFFNGDRDVAVAWSDGLIEVAFDGQSNLHVRDVMGRPRSVRREASRTFVKVGEDPLFIEGVTSSVIPPIPLPPRAAEGGTDKDPAIVLTASVPLPPRAEGLRDAGPHPDGLTADWSPRSYALGGEPVDMTLTIFNLGELTKTCRLEIRGEGLHVTPSALDVAVPGRGRSSRAIRIQAATLGPAVVEITGTADGNEVSATRLQFTIGR